MMNRIAIAVALCWTLTACGSSSPASAPQEADAGSPVRAPQLGDGTPGSATLTEILGPDAKLNVPRDLAFNPVRPNELWVVNFGDDSMVIASDALAEPVQSERRKDGAANHFMAKPSSIAFGADATTFGSVGTFATCQESRNTYDDMAKPNDFMGPVLWTSDLSIFAKQNPKGLGSHLDMLHNSPLCAGIAHEAGNVYWTFAGRSNAIVKYDFRTDNGVGQDDHSDGESWRYGLGAFGYVAGVPSHLVFDATDASLYVADTGNGRIAKLDTKSGTKGRSLATKETQALYVEMTDAVITDVVPGGGDLVRPSGLELRDGLLFVSDNQTSRVLAYTLAGEKVNELDTGLPPGSLAGLVFGPDGKLYLVDMKGNRVFRVDSTAR